MRTIALLNQKGGVGKTTSAVALAALAADAGDHVLLVDADPQGSATRWIGPADPTPGVLADVLRRREPIDRAVVPSKIPGVELAPADGALAVAAEERFGTRVGAHTVLQRALAGAEDRWDRIYLDCPPTLGTLTIAALVAASHLLVPVLPGGMELDHLDELDDTVAAVRDDLGHPIELLGVLLCRADARTVLVRDMLAALEDRYDAALLSPAVPATVGVPEAYDHGQPLHTYGRAAAAGDAYHMIAAELDRRLQEA